MRSELAELDQWLDEIIESWKQDSDGPATTNDVAYIWGEIEANVSATIRAALGLVATSINGFPVVAGEYRTVPFRIAIEPAEGTWMIISRGTNPTILCGTNRDLERCLLVYLARTIRLKDQGF